MRIIALSLALMGISILSLILFFQSPSSISSLSDVSNLQQNQKVSVQGEVIKEKTLSDNRILTLNNSIVLECSCPFSLKGKSISAIAIVNKYNNKIYLKVLRLREND